MSEFTKGISYSAELMAIAARTAPKAAGKDFLKIKIIEGEELKRFGDLMIEYGEKTDRALFDRDGNNIKNSDAMILISLDKAMPAGLNCGACGQDFCKDLVCHEGSQFDGPICAWRLIDLGIALGSAVKTASILNLDNRIMYRAGVIAKEHRLIDGEIVVGIPVSVSGKNIYFDRK